MYKINTKIKKIIRTRPALYREKIKKKLLLLDRQEKVINYNQNIINNISKGIKSLKLNLYPDIPKYYSYIANHFNIDKNKIFFTEGATGCIKVLIEAYTERGKNNIIISNPTFPLYNIFADLHETKIKKINYNKNFSLNIDNYIKAIDKKTSIVFLPNPDCPIDFAFNKKEIEKICKYAIKKKVIVAIDEVYFPYNKKSYISLINKYSNLFIMRSFSKVYGLAGIRLGFIASSKKNILYISKFRSGYETNSLSLYVASYILKKKQLINSYLTQIKNSRNYLVSNLRKNNFIVRTHNNANFIFVDFGSKKKAIQIQNNLRKFGIIVKGNFDGFLKGGILITLADITSMKKLIKNLIKIKNKIEI